MKRRSTYLAGIAVLVCMGFSPAQAALLNFDLTGSRNASFQLDSNPTPDVFSSSFIGNQIQFANVSGTFGGTAGTANISFGTFLISTLNISNASLGFTQFAGPDIFTGTAAMPVFAPNTFNLTSIVSGNSTLTISLANSVATVPLPKTLPLFAAGLVGFGLIRRRKAAPDQARLG
ncbi:hypothetical protein [Lichenifustis flavocetrariae]|uniref:VPLPA-CTERM sorting domain-containing protein n=1 Tax=Lichenifustis flavocetrariae TaxID=2949735 RepID=A0AA42CRZ2_9HYPH|nr:hypothetical protein [Lichenifustis flavocetrariae]MCW6512965.1 hypothetical protein [Lichenifustis flavocetrariae]